MCSSTFVSQLGCLQARRSAIDIAAVDPAGFEHKNQLDCFEVQRSENLQQEWAHAGESTGDTSRRDMRALLQAGLISTRGMLPLVAASIRAIKVWTHTCTLGRFMYGKYVQAGVRTRKAHVLGSSLAHLLDKYATRAAELGRLSRPFA